jgi:predicted nucleic acid-binding protein
VNIVKPQYLIDTRIIIDYLGEKLPPTGMAFMDEVVDAIPNVSILSQIELLSLNVPEEYQQVIFSFMQDAIVLDLSPIVVKNTIALCKTHNLNLQHAIIAATAITYDYSLIVNNEYSYIYIKGLKIINPYQL